MELYNGSFGGLSGSNEAYLTFSSTATNYRSPTEQLVCAIQSHLYITTHYSCYLYLEHYTSCRTSNVYFCCQRQSERAIQNVIHPAQYFSRSISNFLHLAASAFSSHSTEGFSWGDFRVALYHGKGWLHPSSAWVIGADKHPTVQLASQSKSSSVRIHKFGKQLDHSWTSDFIRTDCCILSLDKSPTFLLKEHRLSLILVPSNFPAPSQPQCYCKETKVSLP